MTKHTTKIVKEPTDNNYSWYVLYIDGNFESQFTSRERAEYEAKLWS